MVTDFEQHVVECDLYAEATWQDLYAAPRSAPQSCL